MKFCVRFHVAANRPPIERERNARLLLSMRVQVKPHSGILSFFRSWRGPSTLAIGSPCRRFLAFRSYHSFSAAALPLPELREGGAAMAAYARLQFEDLSAVQRRAIEAALRRYCELDTLAMVMAVQAWSAWLRE